jgi:hypothetical protein
VAGPHTTLDGRETVGFMRPRDISIGRRRIIFYSADLLGHAVTSILFHFEGYDWLFRDLKLELAKREEMRHIVEHDSGK